MKPAGHSYSEIPDFSGSAAWLSNAISDVDQAIIFVHGFGGSAKETWGGFVKLLHEEKTVSQWWQAVDLYFYDYQEESIFQKVSRTKHAVADFVNAIFPVPPEELFRAKDIVLRKNVIYKALTLVGHSEGGLILRKLIVDAASKREDIRDYIRQFKAPAGNQLLPEPSPEGILQARLRLFAPAIGGEAVTGLLGVLLRCGIVSSLTGPIPAKLSMASTSPAVTAARDSTNYYSDYLTFDCFRAHILWADDDNVIEPEKYTHDLECENLWNGTDHRSICKPTHFNMDPITFIELGVKNGKC